MVYVASLSSLSYCTTTPVQLIVTCRVVLLELNHGRWILVVLPQVRVDSFPLAPSHGICGISTIADLCISCHILFVLWVIMAVMLWTRVHYIIHWHRLMLSLTFLSFLSFVPPSLDGCYLSGYYLL